jgi:DNA-binding XRE family transcriptional regulator
MKTHDPDYLLRNIPRQDWKEFSRYCKTRGWDMRFVLLAFIREAPAQDLGTILIMKARHPSTQVEHSKAGAFALNLRTIREKKGLSRRAVARAAGLPSIAHVGMIERGNIQEPRLDVAMKIAEGLGVPLETMLNAKEG